jgi:hypothetical protein
MLTWEQVLAWRMERHHRRFQVEIEPFGRLAAWARAQLEAEAERLSAFLGGVLELRWRTA